MKKKIFMPLLGAVVLGMSAYAGYRTYDAYNGVNESDLLWRWQMMKVLNIVFVIGNPK